MSDLTDYGKLAAYPGAEREEDRLRRRKDANVSQDAVEMPLVVVGVAETARFEDGGQACIVEVYPDDEPGRDDSVFIRVQSWVEGGDRSDHQIAWLGDRLLRVTVEVVPDEVPELKVPRSRALPEYLTLEGDGSVVGGGNSWDEDYRWSCVRCGDVGTFKWRYSAAWDDAMDHFQRVHAGDGSDEPIAVVEIVDGDVHRTAGVAVQVVPIGEPGSVGYLINNAGPEPLTRQEMIRVLRAAADQLDSPPPSV